ncbi:MAG: Mov34/MPN/PAD-1 family protein [Thermoplasmata archaeon]|jgi:proteasome lid subunit RPN8/RPN11|nr:Mov34/MPN/PAD-1 family protein [Thermoplasmata archaeon]
MTRPRIVSETKRSVEEREPPGKSTLRAHEWLSSSSAAAYEEKVRHSIPFEVYLSYRAERRIREHAVRQAKDTLEALGFLLGEVRQWQGREYLVILGVGTTELRSSHSNVRFDPQALPKLFMDLDGSGFDYVIVGWYHSHPGHTCFLSKTDLKTQRTMFNQPYHVALVIDPMNKEIKIFRLAGNSYEEVPFAVFREDQVKNGRNGKPRTRTLKVKPVIPT